MTTIDFPPTRDAALERLRDFVPLAGTDYAAKRNYDLPGHPHVSTLSPYLRHRLLTEEEVLSAVLERWAPSTAGKFIDEVFWRTYWKGWLAQRPQVWTAYRNELRRDLDRVQTEAGLRASWEAACKGETGIDAFDHWARELAEAGYLHNHARMWFASIWIFTLRLPWALGADFFLRHLLDGDPASNTLSWRWVAGLQTQGKNYAARESNIAKYTEGRLSAAGLAEDPEPLDGPPAPERSALPVSDTPDDVTSVLLLTEDDLSPEPLLSMISPAATAVVCGVGHRSPLAVSEGVVRFTERAVSGVRERMGDRLGQWNGTLEDVESVTDWAVRSGAKQVVMYRPAVGPASDVLEGLESRLDASGVRLAQVIRSYDQICHPHAKAGFFKFKKAIPEILEALDLT